MQGTKAIIDTLKTISHEFIFPLLDKKLLEATAIDPAAGIVIVPLNNEPVESRGQKYDFYAARILPNSHVNAHYHLHGEEPYYILSGKGEMNLGIVKNNEVTWHEPQKVSPEKLIEVQEGEVHSLINNAAEALDFTLACPPEHLTDKDRYFTKDLKNGTPTFKPYS